MHKESSILPALTLAAVVVASLFYISPVFGLFGLALAAITLPTMRSLDEWRILVSASLVASFLRDSEFGFLLPSQMWLVVQFGTLLLATMLMLNLTPRALPNARSSVTKLIIALAVWSCFSATWSTNFNQSLQQGLLFLLAAFFLHATFIRRWNTRQHLTGDLLTVYIVIVVVQVVGLVGGVLGQEWAFLWGVRFQGLLANPNYTGILAAFGLIISVYLMGLRRHSLLLTLTQVALLVPMLWSGSRGALVGFLAAILIGYTTSAGREVRARIAIASILGIVLVPLMAPSFVTSALDLFDHQAGGSDISSGRLELWSGLFQTWQSNWLTGIGYRTIEQLSSQDGLAAHNLFLQFFVETGVLGGLLSVAIFLRAWFLRSPLGSASLLAGGAVGVGLVEMTEASLTGFGNSVALAGWLIVVASVRSYRDAETSDAPDLDSEKKIEPHSVRRSESLPLGGTPHSSSQLMRDPR